MTAEQTAPRGPASAPIVRRALRLSLLNTIVGKFGGFFVGVLLARVLAPEDFGVFAVALVALGAVLSLNELGVSLAMVRWQGDPRVIAPTVTTISIASSAALYAVCFFGAPWFAAVMGAPDAVGVLRLICVCVLIDGATAAAVQLVNRDFRQGIRLLVDLLNLVVTTGLTVTLALNGYGAWSLAWGQLVGNAISAVLLMRLVGYWPRPGLDRSRVMALLAFGLPLAGASLVVFGILNVAHLVVGGLLDITALGFYVLAFNLASWPVNTFSAIVRRVALPAFARIQDAPAERERALARLAQLLAVPTLPACALLGGLALPAITTVYGEKWAAAAAALQFLAVLGAVRVVGELCYDYLVSLGRARTCLYLQLLWLACLAVALPIGAVSGGIAGVGLAQAAVAVLIVLPAFALAVGRTGASLGVLLAAVARPLLGTVALLGVVAVVRWLTEPSVLQLVLGGVLGLAAYLPVIWPLRRIVLLRSID